MHKILKFGAVAALAAMSAIPASAQDLASANGIFTADQATRGMDVFEMNCAGCHASNLNGTPGGPGIAGSRFKVKWAKKTVGDFYTKIHDTMPAGMGGSLTEAEYIDIVAYILSVNKFAPGDAELVVDADALKAITIGAAQ